MVPRHALQSRSRLASREAVRPLVLAIHGGAAVVLALEVNRLGDGLVAAAAFMVAIFVGTVTVGLVIACCLESASSIWVRLGRATGATPCGSCGHKMRDLHSVWICPGCDRLPIDS